MACRWDTVWKAEPSPGDLGFLVNEPGAGVPSLQLWHLLQALGLDPALWRAENACQVPPVPRACVHVTLLLPTGTQEPCFVDVDSRAQRGHTACPRSPAGHGWPLLLYHVPSEAPALAGPISPGLCPRALGGDSEAEEGDTSAPPRLLPVSVSRRPSNRLHRQPGSVSSVLHALRNHCRGARGGSGAQCLLSLWGTNSPPLFPQPCCCC